MEQKSIGLIGAMKIEVDAILAALENTRQETHGGMAFTQGVLSGVEVVGRNLEDSMGRTRNTSTTATTKSFWV